SAGFRSHRLVIDKYFCVARAGHPLGGNQISLQDFLAARHVSSGSGNADRLLDTALARRRWRRNVVLRTGHYSVTAAVIAASDLLAVMPQNAIPQRADLQLLALPVKIVDAAVRMFWHRRHDFDPGHSWLREQVIGLDLSHN